MTCGRIYNSADWELTGLTFGEGFLNVIGEWADVSWFTRLFL